MATPSRPSSDPTVVFDLGGVLIDWNPRYLYRRLFDDEEQMEWFLTTVCSMDWNDAMDAGRPFAEAVAEKVDAFPEYEALIRAYFERWDEMLGGSIEGSVEILAELHEQGRPLYALSNWSAETFPEALDRYDFLSWFDGIVLSGEVRVTKPDPAIYHHLLDAYRIEAEEAIFIDDREENVEAAREIGFRGIHFRSPDQLREALDGVVLPG